MAELRGAALIALDFDGVISDSAPEAFAIARLTYADMQPDSRLRPSAPGFEFATDRAPERHAVVGDESYRAFLQLMPLGNRAEDFGIALRALDQRRAIADQKEYDEFKAGVDPSWTRAYHSRFYQIRTQLSQSDPRGWNQLMGPYPDFIAMLRRRRRDTRWAIATAKDRRSVEILLDAYEIADLFSAECILDKETGVAKDCHLQALHQRCSVPYAEMLFIDDKLNHLDNVSQLGVGCALAGWGYNGTREVELAVARGFPVLELDRLEEQLFGQNPAG
jgi:phosphoglycolate phosphatase-like HAD superfamily hydrolase